MGVIKFNNISSDMLGIVVEIPPHYEIAERSYDSIEVPGRGTVLLDMQGYKNASREYQIAIVEAGEDFSSLAPRIADWLNSGVGYLRLEDSYHPDQYALARLANPVQVYNMLQQAGRATITFDRKPKRYLKSGDRPLVINSSTGLTIKNPTQYQTNPLLKVYGTSGGSVFINNKEVKIKDIVEYIIVDCDIRKVHKGQSNKNDLVELPNGWPTLDDGVNVITFNGGITSIELTPRWWRL